MADIEYYEDESDLRMAPAAAGPSAVKTIVNWAGALMSVGLVVGMGLWAWQLTVRDVSGVPVIRALEGPLRVAPENPGGSITDHQGLAVNRITEGEVAEPAADRIVLAPAPLDLEEIDLSSASLPENADPAPDVSSEETMALIDRLVEEALPLDALPDAEEGDEEVARIAPARPVIEVIPATIPGVSLSLRPSTRPEELRVSASASSPATPVQTPEVTELAADELATGTRLVQLGAFDDAATARAEWDRLARAHADYFRDKNRVIQQAVSGGRAFFRLRAHGFTDLSDARRFCTALNAQGAPCIPVTLR